MMISVIWGTPFLLIGIALHLWAKGYLHQDKEVTLSGPYRFIRHPFYLGNLFIDLSIVIMSSWKPLLGVFPFYWFAVYIPIMLREENAMMNLFSDSYRQYAQRIPRLLPIRKPLPPSGKFYWKNDNILKMEIPRAFRFLSYPFLFIISHEIQTNEFTLPPRITPLAFTSLIMVFLFYGLSLQIRKAYLGSNLLNSQWLSRTSSRIIVLSSFALFGSTFPYWEVEAGNFMVYLGLFTIGLSLLVYRMKPKEAFIAEFILLIGASFLWELPWLTILPIFLFSADLVFSRLMPSLENISIQRQRLNFIPYGYKGFRLFLSVCIFSGFAKEVVLDLL